MVEGSAQISQESQHLIIINISVLGAAEEECSIETPTA